MWTKKEAWKERKEYLNKKHINICQNIKYDVSNSHAIFYSLRHSHVGKTNCKIGTPYAPNGGTMPHPWSGFSDVPSRVNQIFHPHKC